MPLIDTGLLARFYADEAASGTTPTSLLDASGNNYDLNDINYGGVMAFAQPQAGQTGLESTATGGDNYARRGIVTGDVIDSALDGSLVATLEIVLRVDSSDSNSRVFGINNRAGAAGIFILRGQSPDPWRISINNGSVRNFNLTWSTRTVIHVVYDSAQVTSLDRVRIYEDGVRAETGGITLPQNTALVMEPDASDLIMFNRESGGNFASSFDGQNFYSAIYSVAMPQLDITNNANVLTLDDDTPTAGSSPNVNPTGSPFGTMASGVPVIPPDDTETVTPVGTPFIILASDVPDALQIVNAGESIAPTGSTFSASTSGVPFIQITLAPVEVSPVGETTQTLEENETADIRHPLQIIMGLGDGDAFFILQSGVPVIDGGDRDLTLRLDAFNLGAGSALPSPESGIPLISSTTVGNINLTVPGSTFLVLQPDDPIPPPDNAVPAVEFAIDTDRSLSGILGSEFGLESGVVSFTNLQTGVLGTLPGSTLGLLASSTVKFAFSHPTAPPGTAGGSLIIRSITQNITRPVTLTTEIRIAVATG